MAEALARACACVDGMLALSELRAEIVKAEELVAAAEAYVAKKEAAPAAGSREQEGEKRYRVLLEKQERREHDQLRLVEVRKYEDGEYKVCVDGRREQTLREEDVRRMYPKDSGRRATAAGGDGGWETIAGHASASAADAMVARCVKLVGIVGVQRMQYKLRASRTRHFVGHVRVSGTVLLFQRITRVGGERSARVGGGRVEAHCHDGADEAGDTRAAQAERVAVFRGGAGAV